MTDSILDSVKKVMNVSADDASFDPDLILHINAALSVMTQLGVGPSQGFFIEDSSATWAALLNDDPRLNDVKQSICMSVRLAFDPPGTSFGIQAIQDQLKELHWRINTQAEEDRWIPSSQL